MIYWYSARRKGSGNTFEVGSRPLRSYQDAVNWTCFLNDEGSNKNNWVVIAGPLGFEKGIPCFEEEFDDG